MPDPLAPGPAGTGLAPPSTGHDPVGGCGSGADGLSRSHELGPDADVGAVTRSGGREIRRRVAIEYREHATRGARGTGAGDAQRWARQILEPTVAWEPLLTRAVRHAVGWVAGRGDHTYSRPSRRAGVTPGIVLPGQHRPAPRVAVVIDTSASVDDQLLGRALGEIDNVVRALGVSDGDVTLLSVDAAVHSTQSIRRARDARLIGAGGTDMRTGLAAAADLRPRVEIVIVLTDGDTPWPTSPPPAASVIVAVLGRRGQPLPPTPSWATRVECLVADERRSR